ncbi:response regulator containing a CheY-like receiver [Photorhabdus khanii NC19]|uniref:Response regulator containing a CheY-like receiver n=1 Tax=Photorhabdus khanii NC19 TaxID=1004151 RepID=W3V3U9_9GAMM|nr:PAS and helix-turn-helix domain-containing protein [Photorhabdus khanii]ETS29729.1 response regulator containing a CheY-like receiver [Photorhabdus khanii NC19]
MNYKKLTVSPQIINLMETSHEPWGIKDKSSRFVYENKAMAMLRDLPVGYNVEGRLDNDLPWNGAAFAEQFQIHDRAVMQSEQRICSLETHLYGKEKLLSSYFFEKFPFYNENNQCVGVIFHAWKAKAFSLTRFFYGKLPASIMFQPPSELFTQREWDVIFLFLQKYTSKQIGQILNISYRTVETHMLRIYKKIGINSGQQLDEYCRLNDFDLYVPERFLKPGSKMFI